MTSDDVKAAAEGLLHEVELRRQAYSCEDLFSQDIETVAQAALRAQADVEWMRQALSFARGTLEDLGSSLVPIRDGTELSRLARRALDTLDDLTPAAQPTEREQGVGT